MIYKYGFFAKELKNAYIEREVSNRNQIRFGAFLALGAFAVYFVLQTLTQSVLFDVAPEFMLPSYFSTLFIYINFIFVCMTVYFLVNYQYLTFSETITNRWYVLVSMGYNPLSMIFGKLFARLTSIFFVYSFGFLITLFLTTFLKYSLVTDYIFSLYLAGIIDIILIATVTMTSSLFIKAQEKAKYVVFLMACILLFSKIASGYYDIVSDRALMGNVGNLFNFSKSLYLVFAAGVLFVCFVVSTVYAYRSAHRYNFPLYRKDLDFGPDVEIVLKTGGKFKLLKKRSYTARARKTAVDTVLGIVMIGIISILLLFNALVLVMSLSTPGKEVSFFGTIPYVFKSDTMKPDLQFNDLVFFKKLTPAEPVNVQDIVIYLTNGEVAVSRIQTIANNAVSVNIDSYSPNSKPDFLKETVERDQIYGRYAGNNRWLGALILFCNTVFGRIAFLLIPAFLIFYNKSILGFFKKVSQ